MTIFIRYEDMSAAGASADAICIGDSWFWHPMGNLTPELDNIFRGQNILLIGESGEEAAGLADANGRYLDTYRRALTDCAGTLRHVFISAGGNDFAGLDDFAGDAATPGILKPDCSAAAVPADCFDLANMRHRFDQIGRDVSTLVSEANRRAPNAEVRLHNYDYAIPDGRRAIGGGKWLKAPMDQCHVPQPDSLQRGGFRREVVAALIDTFGVWMDHVAQRHANTRFIRTSGTLSDGQWLDELHPTAAGFRKIARVFAG